MQMMIAQQKRRERTNITVSPVPRRHDLPVRQRKIKQVAEVLPPARRSQRKTVPLPAFHPLLQVGAHFPGIQIRSEKFQPNLNFTEKLNAHTPPSRALP